MSATLYRHPMGTVAYPCHDHEPKLEGELELELYATEIRHRELVVFLYRQPMKYDRNGWQAAGWWPAEHGPRLL